MLFNNIDIDIIHIRGFTNEHNMAKIGHKVLKKKNVCTKFLNRISDYGCECSILYFWESVIKYKQCSVFFVLSKCERDDDMIAQCKVLMP